MNLKLRGTDMTSGSKRRKGPKLASLKSLKRKLDQAFSRYIRERDALPNGMGYCFTCNHYRTLEASHFVPRQHLATRWDERNVHGACAYCNRWLHGNLAEFYLRLVTTYGQPIVDELMALKRITVKYTRSELEDLIKRYS